MQRFGVRFVFLIAAAGVLPAWSQTTAIAAGVPNFAQVNDHIFRGGQPPTTAISSLAKLGVKTVIDLRAGDEHSLAEQKLVEAAGMRYIHIPMANFGAPNDDDVRTVLGLFDNGSAWPVFVHCRRGADRTGTVVACYRITHDHWDNGKALKEAKLHGMSRLERGMQQYVLHFDASAFLHLEPRPIAGTP
jgi:uncharacterized protein (TIGR01244 family)